jgi:hypothetical protein
MYMFLLCLGSVFVLTGLIILVLDYKLTAIKIIKCLNHILLQVVSIYGEDEEYVWLTFRNIFVIDDHGYGLFYPLPLS